MTFIYHPALTVLTAVCRHPRRHWACSVKVFSEAYFRVLFTSSTSLWRFGHVENGQKSRSDWAIEAVLMKTQSVHAEFSVRGVSFHWCHTGKAWKRVTDKPQLLWKLDMNNSLRYWILDTQQCKEQSSTIYGEKRCYFVPMCKSCKSLFRRPNIPSCGLRAGSKAGCGLCGLYELSECLRVLF